MQFFAGLLLFAVQLSVEQSATLDAGMAEMKVIDEELHQIQDNQETLAKSVRAREAEIAVLNRRYPDIVLKSGASVSQIYRALYATRMSRATKLRPLARAKLKAATEASCRAAQALQGTRKEIEDGGGLDKMSLEERLEWQKNMDALSPPTGCK